MAKNKNNQAIWSTRIKKNASSLFQKVGNSIDIDKRLYKEDIQGSIAHVEMLFKQKIISFKIKNKPPKNLKILLSLGGWGGCAPCSEVFSTENGRNNFAESVKLLTNFFGSDGIDLDWEYPAISGFPNHTFKSQDKDNFTLLIQELRNVMNSDDILTLLGWDLKIENRPPLFLRL